MKLLLLTTLLASPLLGDQDRTHDQNSTRKKRQVAYSTSYGTDSNLRWDTWTGSLPKDAVSVYIDNQQRTDYICKVNCHAGVYNPGVGPLCTYVSDNTVKTSAEFKVLVNSDNFEVLQWKDSTRGSVPEHSVKTCPSLEVYVGRNQYGLGEVLDKYLYLAQKGKYNYYSKYQVLTVFPNVIRQKIDNVNYDMGLSKVSHFPPEVIRRTSVFNCRIIPLEKKDFLSNSYLSQKQWEITSSVKIYGSVSMKFKILFISEAGIVVGGEETRQFSEGLTLSETVTDSVTMDLVVPANHSCKIDFVRYRYLLQIPFTARLSRTYGNDEERTTNISGTYSNGQVGEIRTIVHRCELLDKTKDCSPKEDEQD